MSLLPLFGLLTSVAATTLGLVWLDKHLTKVKKRRAIRLLEQARRTRNARLALRVAEMEAEMEADAPPLPVSASRPPRA